MFSFKLIVANCLLILISGFLLLKNIEIWQKDLPYLPQIEVKKTEDGNTGKLFYQKKVLPPSFYSVILSQNLFSPERVFTKIEDEKTVSKPLPIEPIETVAKVLERELFVHGITIIGDYRTALISNYYYLVRKERPLKLVKIGDLLEDFKVTEIEPKHVMLQRNGRKYKVKLYDASKPNNKRSVGTATTNERRGKDSPTVISTPRNTVPNKKTEKKDSLNDQEEYEIIQTPFGTVKRKIQR